jgi:hypothetical protein
MKLIDNQAAKTKGGDMNSPRQIKVRFGPITSSEIDVMLTAAMESGDQTAESILKKCREVGRNRGYEYELTFDEANYLSLRLFEDSERVGMACGEAAGRAFEAAGERLYETMVRARGRGSSMNL